MLYEEARWIGKEIEKLAQNSAINSVLNIGSSTSESWQGEQQHIKLYIIDKLKQNGLSITNTDIKNGVGVDIAGDLNDPHFISDLASRKFQLIICANLLEHVANPEKIAESIIRIIQPGGFAIITVPYVYPYHPDPDDFLFRPDINKLKSLFPHTMLISSDIVKARKAKWKNEKIKYFSNHAQVLLDNPRLLFISLVRLITPFYKFKNWKKTACYWPKVFKKFSVTCLVIEKKP